MNKLLTNIHKFNIKILLKRNNKTIENLICVRNKVTIPKDPYVQNYLNANQEVEIEVDEKLIKHLERLSLVSMSGPEFLNSFKRSIRFASNIKNIDTTNVEPLYTVLEDERLQMRPDSVKVDHSREDILRMAKCTEEDYYIAPPGNIPME